MKCETIRPLLTRYLLSDLDEVTMKRVREHLKACEACRAEAWEIKPTLEILRDALADPTSAPKHLSGARHQDIIHRSGTKGAKIDWWITRKQPALSVSAAALIMIAVVFALMIATPSMLKSRKSAVEISIMEPEAIDELEEIEEIMDAPAEAIDTGSEPDKRMNLFAAFKRRGSEEAYNVPKGSGTPAPVDVKVKDTGGGGDGADYYMDTDIDEATTVTYARNAYPGKAGSGSAPDAAGSDDVDKLLDEASQLTYSARGTAKPKPSSGKKIDGWTSLGLSGETVGDDTGSYKAGKMGKGGGSKGGWPEGMDSDRGGATKDMLTRDYRERNLDGRTGGRIGRGDGGRPSRPQPEFIGTPSPAKPRLPAAATPPPPAPEPMPAVEAPPREEFKSLKPQSRATPEREIAAKREEVRSRQLASSTVGGTRGDAVYGYADDRLEAAIGGEQLQRGAEVSRDKESRKKFNMGDIPLIGRMFKGGSADASSAVAPERPAEAVQIKVLKKKKKMRLEKESMERFAEESAPAADMPATTAERGRTKADETKYRDHNANWEISAEHDGKPAANEQKRVVEDAKRLLRETRLSAGAELSLDGYSAGIKSFNGSDPADSQGGPANAPADVSLTPARFDSVSIVKSPMIVDGAYANRMPGAREKALEEYGADDGFTEETPQQQAFFFAIPDLAENAEVDGRISGDVSEDDGVIIFNGSDVKHGVEMQALSGNVLTYEAEGEDLDGDGLRDMTEADHLVAFKKVAEKQVPLSEREKDRSGPTFKAVGVNPFVDVDDNAFSTFGIDVDTASYTMMRNMVARGSLPAAESVRTEEFVNFFDYAYAPATHNTFRIYTEVAPSKFGRGLHMMKIGVKGRRLGREEQRQAVLTFLIDTSGSMNQPDRLGLVKKSLTMLLKQLNPEDKVAIVQYDSHARLVIEHTPAGQLKQILEAIERMQTGGSTNLEEGMNKAYELAANNFVPGGENRVLLLSDGVANLGSGGADDILARVEGYRKQGVFCSVFGFGVGAYDDTMLETLANKGDGTYAFIDSMAEARRVFVDDLSATLNTIAKDVKIQVEFKDDVVERYRQLGYENRQLTKEQFRDDSVDAGEVGSGQSVTALYELELGRAPGRRGASLREDPVVAIVRVRYRRTDNGRVEEIEQPVKLSQVRQSFDDAETHFKLAACVAEYAEILRGCPHAVGSTFRDVSEVLTPVALELTLDTRVQELLRMVNQANGLPRGE